MTLDLVALPGVSSLIDLALEEDLGRGDITSTAVFEGRGPLVDAAIIAREPIVVSGLDVAAAVFRRVGNDAKITLECEEGTFVKPGDVILAVRGFAVPTLAAERTALNFLQRLCGVATGARKYAQAVGGTGARVVDTRKTTPGYRVLEKRAVVSGGCANHRADLGSGVLIKDNHIAAAGSLTVAVQRALRIAPHSLRIEVEVDTESQLREAIEAGAHVVLLDNMSPDQVEQLAPIAKGAGILVEVSGGITLETVRAYAVAGADVISAGALTHSAIAVDIGLDIA